MKKTFTLIALAALNLAAFGQEITFKVDYKANSTYTQKMDMDMMMDIKQEGQGNMEQPMDMAIIYTVNTGKAATNGDIPFTASMKMENDMVPNLDEINNNKYYGHFTKGVPAIDSLNVAGQAMGMGEEQLKQAFSRAIAQFPVEGKKLKVGESFKINNLPINLGGMDLGTNDTSITYTLKKVEGTKATFDVLLDTPLDITTQGVAMKGKIKITGTMLYMTDAKYVPSQDLLMDATFDMASAGVSMNMKGKTIVTTTVTSN